MLHDLAFGTMAAQTYVMKSGKTVTTQNGVTTITKMQDGKSVTKTYNLNNLNAGTLIGNAGHVKIGNGQVRVGSGRPKPGPGPGPGGPGSNPGGGGGGRRVNNQFNITGSVIGQVAIGNKGPTTFNNTTQKFQAGAVNSDFNISGGNFSQANIGGAATYNNDKSNVGAGTGAIEGTGSVSLEDLLYSDMVAEKRVLSILQNGIDEENFIALLKKGLTIEKIEGALSKSPNSRMMIESMLRYDGKEDSDSD